MRPNIFGVILVLFGFLFLLDNLGIADFGDVIHRFWPLILIIWGFILLFNAKKKREYVHQQNDTTEKTFAPFPQNVPEYSYKSNANIWKEDAFNESNVFGDMHYDISSAHFHGGRISNVFGDVKIDITKAVLRDGDNMLDMSGVFGDMTLLVPRDMAISVTMSATFGDVRVFDSVREGVFKNLQYRSPDFESSQKRLHITCSTMFGDCKVW